MATDMFLHELASAYERRSPQMSTIFRPLAPSSDRAVSLLRQSASVLRSIICARLLIGAYVRCFSPWMQTNAKQLQTVVFPRRDVDPLPILSLPTSCTSAPVVRHTICWPLASRIFHTFSGCVVSDAEVCNFGKQSGDECLPGSRRRLVRAHAEEIRKRTHYPCSSGR
jgi:hypothetical protein